MSELKTCSTFPFLPNDIYHNANKCCEISNRLTMIIPTSKLALYSNFFIFLYDYD